MKSEKVTSAGKQAEKRWYDDACGTAHAMELVGERWSLLVLREMMFGPRRFTELRRHLPGISANVLTQRLEGLEAAGVVRRRRLPSPANAQVYELTEWGYQAERMIQELGRWAARSPDHDPTLYFSPVSAMLSLRTMVDGARARALSGSIAFRFPDDAFVVRLEDGALPIVRGEAAADVTVVTDPPTLAAVIYGKWPIAEAEVAGTLRIEGDAALFAAFVDLFELPAKAAIE
jgi:DNA-binding HxlR family transcriptional regulator/putative sterol carrier protein